MQECDSPALISVYFTLFTDTPFSIFPYGIYKTNKNREQNIFLLPKLDVNLCKINTLGEFLLKIGNNKINYYV